MKADTYNRARIEILSWVTSFSLKLYFGEGAGNLIDPKTSFVGGICKEWNEYPIGSLVAMKAGPSSKWYLSWLVDSKNEGIGGKYLLKSIEDGSLCWWTNVAFDYLPLETCEQHPTWQWSDRQHEFNDLWFRACKKRGAYIRRPNQCIFHEDGTVTISLRTMFDRGPSFCCTIENWKTTKQHELLWFYDTVESENK